MRLHYSDMKKGHCQDGKNTSAPFYLFPQHWDCGGGRLNCLKKGYVGVCVREKERVYVKVCVCARDKDIETRV